MNLPPQTSTPALIWARRALVGYWLLLFGLTHTPRLPQPPDVEGIDKIGHFIAYGLLAILFLAWLHLRGAAGWRAYGLTLAVLVVYGVLDELLQYPVGRSTELFDWYADVLGILAGSTMFAVSHFLGRKIKR